MKTTLKRGMGRSAASNGNGRAVFPPGVRTPMTRYRQPEPEPRGAWHLLRLVLLWTILAALVVAGGAAGAAYLRAHRFIAKTEPKSAIDRAAAKAADVAIPGQPTTALVIGTDRRSGPEAELTGRSDTLLLVRADPQSDTISLLSFPRDLGVTIKCPGKLEYHDRINSAFSECGSLGSLETVRGADRAADQLLRHCQLPRLPRAREQARRRVGGHRPSLPLQRLDVSGRDPDRSAPGYQRLTGGQGARIRALPPLRL